MSGDETVRVDPAELDHAPVGEELSRADYAVLAALGLVLPAILLVWGWM